MKYYVQCDLRKQIETGLLCDVAWIPEKFAVIGKQVRIKQEDGTWDSGWMVAKRYAKMEEDEVEAAERDYLIQRESSDV
jgi:hypothetical protein